MMWFRKGARDEDEAARGDGGRAPEAGERVAALEAEAAGLRSALASERAKAEALAAEKKAAVQSLEDAAWKYREVRLANAPDIPAELVPLERTLAEIDEHFASAERVVQAIEGKLEERRRNRTVPAGSPGRTPYRDTSALSAREKIRIGLQRLAEEEGRRS
jgi:hypothetical protein